MTFRVQCSTTCALCWILILSAAFTSEAQSLPRHGRIYQGAEQGAKDRVRGAIRGHNEIVYAHTNSRLLNSSAHGSWNSDGIYGTKSWLNNPWRSGTLRDRPKTDSVIQGRHISRVAGARKCWGGQPLILDPHQYSTEGLPPQHRYGTCGDGVTATLYIDPVRTGVSWKGFGTSLSRMGSWLGTFPPAQMDCFARLLFSPSMGLGLRLARFQIVGGYKPGSSPALEKMFWADRGFHPQPWGTHDNRMPGYRWNADANQMRFLKAAKKYGVVFEAVAYAPPWWATRSGDVTGGWTPSNFNLGYTGQFAQYLADVVAHFRWTHGVEFDGLVPFNEALEGWWSGGINHEACSFTVDDMNHIYPRLQHEFQVRRLRTKIVGMDSWIDWTLGALNTGPGARLSGQVRSILRRLDIHGYRHADAMQPGSDFTAMDSVRQLAARMRVPVWQTEWGPKEFGPGSNVPASQLDLGLLLGRVIIQNINIMGVEAWFYWQAVDIRNPIWGLLRANYFHPPLPNTRPVLTKQFYVMFHFTHTFVHGAQPLRIQSACVHNVAAAYVPQYATVVINIVNQRQRGKWIWVRLRGVRPLNPAVRRHTVQQIRTSATENYKKVKLFAVGTDRQAFRVYSDPESINSLRISNVAPF